ncbi:MAG TPA: hypothetical protein VGB63_16875 [Pedobacter sp.]|jgi:hypothetical protein
MEKVSIPFELATTKLDTWENAEDAFLTEITKVIVKRQRINKLRVLQFAPACERIYRQLRNSQNSGSLMKS